MKKRSSMQPHSNYGGGQHRKNRFSQGGGSGGGHHQHSGNRPRKNYSATREKYLAQARDALASGDRVLAENFYQHADHCYRMMVEEGQNRPQPPRPQQNGAPQEDGTIVTTGQEEVPEVNTTALPAFITGGYNAPEQPAAVPVQNWEERDEA